MITNNTYYKGEIYIPQAKPSITDEVVQLENDFQFILDKYEEDCLIKCLGLILYELFIDELDSSKENCLKDTADEKWDKLLNGTSYVDPQASKVQKWRGIRFKTPLNSEKYNRSFLAYYVYFYYERKQYITTTNVGTGKPDAENLKIAEPTQKVVNAWNEFVKLVQGVETVGTYLRNSSGLIGIDYYSGSNHVDLYKYIKDMNTINGDDYYPNFEPTKFDRLNEFGI